MSDQIVSKVYRVLRSAPEGLWDKISFWNKAADTEAADGKSLETKVGAIDGVTSDVSSTSTNYAASIKTVHDLNSNLTADIPFRFGKTDDGKYGYIVNQGGADTVIPFSNGTPDLLWTNSNPATNFSSLTLTVENLSDYKSIIIDNRQRGHSQYVNEWTHASLIVIPIVQNHAYYLNCSGQADAYRRVSISGNTISIASGPYSGAYEIPYKIYGSNLDISSPYI